MLLADDEALAVHRNTVDILAFKMSMQIFCGFSDGDIFCDSLLAGTDKAYIVAVSEDYVRVLRSYIKIHDHVYHLSLLLFLCIGSTVLQFSSR